MNTVELLKASKDWLSDESHWLKTGLFSNHAGQTCLLGAIFKYEPDKDIRIDAVGRVMNCLPATNCSIASWNDDLSTTHKDLMRVLECAIEVAEQIENT